LKQKFKFSGAPLTPEFAYCQLQRFRFGDAARHRINNRRLSALCITLTMQLVGR